MYIYILYTWFVLYFIYCICALLAPVTCSCFEDKPNPDVMFLSCKSLSRPTSHRCKWICILAIAGIISIASSFGSLHHTWTGSHLRLNMPSTVSTWAGSTQDIDETFHSPNPSHQHPSTSFLITEPLMATPSPNQPETTSRVTLQPPLHLCPETKTEMTEAEVSSHFLNICTEEVVPMFTFPTPLDDPKFHEGQRCLTVVASVILGGYDDFSFEVPGAWNYHGSKISYASRYGMCWFLFLDWNSSKKIVPLEYRNATIDVCPSCNISIIKVRAWNVLVIPSKMMPLKTAGRNSRLFKMLLHRAFTTAEILVYLDGDIHLNPAGDKVLKDHFGSNSSALEGLFFDFAKRSLSPGPDGVRPAWASPKHPNRCTTYHEGWKMCTMGLSGDSGVQQMHHYHADGFPTVPSHYPYLLDGSWHVRDLKRVESSLMGCAWMAEYLRWDHPRDQLSFNYAMWKLSQCINQKEEDFLRIGVQLAIKIVKRFKNPYHGKKVKREMYGSKQCPEIRNYTNECNKTAECRQCKAAAWQEPVNVFQQLARVSEVGSGHLSHEGWTCDAFKSM